MEGKNLPIIVVMQKDSDIEKNIGGGEVKFFGDVTPEVQTKVCKDLENVQNYYKDVFEENDKVPAVGKVVVKEEAIAKSHKPKDLFRYCPIIGTEDLNEIYVKVTKKGIENTIALTRMPTSEKVKANLTVVKEILPINTDDVISKNLLINRDGDDFSKIKKKIKIKLFDFDDPFDNEQINNYVLSKLKDIGLENSVKKITYGERINYLKVEVQSYEQVERIASINGVKNIDFFRDYSLPVGDVFSKSVPDWKYDSNVRTAETIIGIIDGGISDNKFLASNVIAREEYVDKVYQNREHGTFIASMIQFGNQLNGIKENDARLFNFVDIIAIPNSDKKYGPVDSIIEDELMEIIEDTMEKYSENVKIWNLSVGIQDRTCTDKMSDLGVFLDYIQDKYGVQIFVSSGNIKEDCLREWPLKGAQTEEDRIISPADSLRAITVGAIANKESDDTYVRTFQPSPFSRRGPGISYNVKPDVVDFGGNVHMDGTIKNVGVIGLNSAGDCVEGVGTSYSTPRVLQKYACVYDDMKDKDALLTKAMIIHSARMNSRDLFEKNQDLIKYYGFGMPSTNSSDILQCSDDEVTLVFRQKVSQGFHLEMFDFPFPKSLIYNGKYHGEIGMTLVYNPILDVNYGSEYCRVNIDASFGTYKYGPDGKVEYKGQVPIETSWDEKYEKSRVENGFKWNPVKSYYRKISNRGINVADGWKVRIDMSPRSGMVPPQEFVLIVTIKDPNKNDIYTEMVNGLRDRRYILNNLETRYQIRQRQ